MLANPKQKQRQVIPEGVETVDAWTLQINNFKRLKVLAHHKVV